MLDKRTTSQRVEVLGADTTETAVTSRCNLIKFSQDTIQQQEEHDRKPMMVSIPNVGVTTEVEANPVAD